MKEVVARAQQAANLTVEMPDSVIPAKRPLSCKLGNLEV